jgi:hypothetical protein
MGIFDKLRKSGNTSDAFTELMKSDWEHFTKLIDAVHYCKSLDDCFFLLLFLTEQLGTPEAKEAVDIAKAYRVFVHRQYFKGEDKEKLLEQSKELESMNIKEFRKFIHSFTPTFYKR